MTRCMYRRELSTWWFHLHRALATLGFILAIVGAATGGGLADDDYHSNNGGSAHKALGILAIVAAALQVEHLLHVSTFTLVICSSTSKACADACLPKICH